MQPRASGGWEPDAEEQTLLTDLYWLSATALAGSRPSRQDRLTWTVAQFVKERQGHPNVHHKWVWVWSMDNLGLVFPRV